MMNQLARHAKYGWTDSGIARFGFLCWERTQRYLALRSERQLLITLAFLTGIGIVSE